MRKIDVHEMPPVISDNGKVSLGAVSPAFPPARRSPATETDKVRLGAVSPAFPPARSK